MTEAQPETAQQATTDGPGAPFAPKARKLELAKGTDRNDYYLLTFPRALTGIQVGELIERIGAIVPASQFHFSASEAAHQPMLLDHTMLAFSNHTSATAEVLAKLVAAFDPEIHLIGVGSIRAGHRSFEVTFSVLNFDGDTPDDRYRELTAKLERIPRVREVIWETGDHEIYVLLSGDYRDDWDDWTSAVETTAGITLQLDVESPLSGLPVVTLTEFLRRGCGHKHS